MKRSVREISRLGRAALWAQIGLRKATDVAYTVTLEGRPHVRNKGTITIGDRSMLLSAVSPIELVAYKNAVIDIGEQAFINYGCSISARQHVVIGDGCFLGPHCTVIDNDEHTVEPERRLHRPESRPVVLERNVWLATRVIVLGGVTIGEGSVVGAGSVVSEDVPPRTLVAGLPAKVIRTI